MPRLLLLSGCSGSGKTTFREKLRAASDNFVEISSDDYIDAQARLNGKAYQDVYMQYRDAAKEAVREKLSKAVAAGRDIIWDQTNLTAKTRRECLDLIPDEYTLVGIGVEAPLGLTLERIFEREKDTGKAVPEEIVRTQHAGYERPHFDEGFDHVMIVHAPDGRIEQLA